MGQVSRAAGGEGLGTGMRRPAAQPDSRSSQTDQGQSGRVLAFGVIRRVISRCASHPRTAAWPAAGSYLVDRVRWVLTFFFSVFYLTPYAFLLTEGQGG